MVLTEEVGWSNRIKGVVLTEGVGWSNRRGCGPDRRGVVQLSGGYGPYREEGVVLTGVGVILTEEWLWS